MGGIADVGHAVDLAAHTGLRLGDLVRLSWSHAGEDAITGKSKHRRTAIIPLYDDLRVVLANIPKRSTTILTNVRRPSSSDRTSPSNKPGASNDHVPNNILESEAYPDAREVLRRRLCQIRPIRTKAPNSMSAAVPKVATVRNTSADDKDIAGLAIGEAPSREVNSLAPELFRPNRNAAPDGTELAPSQPA
jgi:hypothetical protein